MKSNEISDIELYAAKRPVWESLKASGLEFTNFAPGVFMNAFVVGTPREQDEALNGLRPFNFVVNVKQASAIIPGDGNAKITFTTIGDVGKFVTAALDLGKWDQEMGMVGETLSFNEIVAIAEQVTHRKFLVKYKSIEEIEEIAAKAPASQPFLRFACQIEAALAKGAYNVPPTLNHIFPAINPWQMRDWLEKWWGGTELPRSELGNLRAVQYLR
ncbi:hypothetical protein MMC19_000949 [Ptychographa xylographoides]|nr:hypothetical protein [Ptychographa xylographoides]